MDTLNLEKSRKKLGGVTNAFQTQRLLRVSCKWINLKKKNSVQILEITYYFEG